MPRAEHTNVHARDEARQAWANESPGDSPRLSPMALEGVAAMVRAAVWLENRRRLETLNIGPGDLDRKDSCTLELAGRHLFYSVLLWVRFSVRAIDAR
jgi:hypothetical protein